MYLRQANCNIKDVSVKIMKVLSRTRKELASREHLRETIKLVNFYCVAFKNKPHSQPEAPDRWFTEQGGNFLKDISPGKQFR